MSKSTTAFNNRKRKRLKFFISLAAACCVLLFLDSASLAFGQTWWDSDWSYRKELTFDNSGQSDNLENFTVLVKLSASNFDYSHGKSDGTDLRFIDEDDSTELKHHIEDWDTSGTSYVWVKVTQINGSSPTDFIWMYYGNSGASDVQDTSGTYDSSFVGVWHLNETSSTHYDATSNNNDGTPEGGLVQDTTGMIDGADEFDGADDRINCGAGGSLDITSAITLEAWVNTSGDEAILAMTDSSEFDGVSADKPDMIHISGDVYAVAYKGPGNHGFLKTIEIATDGSINTEIDTLEFDALKGDNPDIINVSGDVYAIAYKDNDNYGVLKTVEIATNGSITDTPIDSLDFDGVAGDKPVMIHISGDVYAVTYKGPSNHGLLKTFEIATAGSISTVIDSLEFDPVKGDTPDIINVSGDIYAIAYKNTNNYGVLKTVEIATNGSITDTPIDSLDFDTVSANVPDMIHISGDVYAVAYKGGLNHGTLKTIEIATNGNINSVIDTFEFDPVKGDVPDMVYVSGDIYAVAYKNTNNYGVLKAIEIATDGSITGTAMDSMDFETVTFNNPDMIHVSGNVFAIAYKGPSNYGWLRTVEMRAVYTGMLKAGAYRLDAYETTACVSINERTISGAISSGWNYAVLTYDKEAGSSQLKLYANGTLETSETLTESIGSNTDSLTIGDYFTGGIDEVRISNVSRSADWIKAQYLSMNSSFITYSQLVETYTSMGDVARSAADGDITIYWRSASGKTYDIFYCDTLQGTYVDVADVSGSGDTTSWVDDGSATGTHPDSVVARFYRVENQIGALSRNTVGKMKRSIASGMQLVSNPFIPDSSSIQSVFGGQLTGAPDEGYADRVWKYDTETGDYVFAWLVAGVGAPYDGKWWSSQSFEQSSMDLGADCGFWIQSRNGAQDITFVGQVSDTSDRVISIVAGMQLFGSAYPDTVLLKDSELCEDGATGAASELNADRVWWWIADSSYYDYAWLVDSTGSPSDSLWWDSDPWGETSITLRPGEGYWYQARGNPFTWSYLKPYNVPPNPQ